MPCVIEILPVNKVWSCFEICKFNALKIKDFGDGMM